MSARLPYFTLLIEQLDANDPDFAVAFDRHVHWGFWDRPDLADGTVADFARATERLCRRVCDAANIRADQNVLDVGCGFGGTIQSIDERISPLDLVGLNIDDRQLARARERVKAHEGNSILFVEGDACALPFTAESFDVVLAVECIFHFPSRLEFLREAARVLVPHGRVVITDFVATGKPPDPIAPEVAARVERFYGPGTVITLDDYRSLAAESGLEITAVDDVTPGMTPSWPFAKNLLARLGEDAVAATAMLEQQARDDIVHYLIVSFEPRRHPPR